MDRDDAIAEIINEHIGPLFDGEIQVTVVVRSGEELENVTIVSNDSDLREVASDLQTVAQSTGDGEFAGMGGGYLH